MRLAAKQRASAMAEPEWLTLLAAETAIVSGPKRRQKNCVEIKDALNEVAAIFLGS
jgi:hypothetical protein